MGAPGRTAPRRQGGDRRSGTIEAHARLLLAEIAAPPDRTLAEHRALLARAGVAVSNGTPWRFCDRHGLTLRKGRATRLSCTDPVRDSPRESSVAAGLHEQGDTPRLQHPERARLERGGQAPRLADDRVRSRHELGSRARGQARAAADPQ